MIKSLHIQNFKGWKDTGEITLAPITVFFGGNSSGKSSIGQFLMLLKQSMELSDRKSIFFTGNDNTAVDLGLPSDIIYNRKLEEPIIFSYEWSLDELFSIRDAVNKKIYYFDAIRFEGQVKVKDITTQAMEVSSFSYKLFKNNEYQMEIGMAKKGQGATSKREYKLTTGNYNLVRNTGRAWDITAPIRFYGFPDEAMAYYKNASYLHNLNFLHETLFAGVYYLGPLRTKARRFYPWSGRTPDSVGFSGEDTVVAILAAKNENRLFNYKYKRTKTPFEQIVAEMLIKMNLIENFKIEQISENRQDYDVKVRTRGSQIWNDIPDVGFGISQVLPVIAQLFYAPSGSTIIMEQPELHLHPSAQAGLADVVAEAIFTRVNGKDRNIQVIIETHSEHFLRRLQRKIAEQQLKSNELQAYFANNNTTPPTLDIIQVDDYGNILNWPEGFFGDITGDIYAQADAALRRRMEQSE